MKSNYALNCQISNIELKTKTKDRFQQQQQNIIFSDKCGKNELEKSCQANYTVVLLISALLYIFSYHFTEKRILGTIQVIQK